MHIQQTNWWTFSLICSRKWALIHDMRLLGSIGMRVYIWVLMMDCNEYVLNLNVLHFFILLIVLSKYVVILLFLEKVTFVQWFLFENIVGKSISSNWYFLPPTENTFLRIMEWYTFEKRNKIWVTFWEVTLDISTSPI